MALPQLRRISPLRPVGKGMQVAADTLRGAGGAISQLGDAAVNAAAPALDAMGTAVGAGLGELAAGGLTMASQALNGIPYVGPALATGATAVSNVAPRIGAAIATQAPKVLGRMAHGAATNLLGRVGSTLDGGMGEQTERALANMGTANMGNGGIAEGAEAAIQRVGMRERPESARKMPSGSDVVAATKGATGGSASMASPPGSIDDYQFPPARSMPDVDAWQRGGLEPESPGTKAIRSLSEQRRMRGVRNFGGT